MLNDWKWKKIDESEYRLQDTNDKMIGYIVHNYDDIWYCRFYNVGYDMVLHATFKDIKSIDEVIWQATLWIYNTCNQIANSFHHIRDHLPSIHELAEAARVID